MATKPENTFIASVHGYLPSVHIVHREKMANPYRAGGADCWYSGHGPNSRDLWIEWKFVPNIPIRTPVDLLKDYLSGLQVDWLRERHTEGRNVWVGVGCPGGGFFLQDPCAWETPIWRDEFKSLLCPRQVMAQQMVSFLCPEHT